MHPLFIKHHTSHARPPITLTMIFEAVIKWAITAIPHTHALRLLKRLSVNLSHYLNIITHPNAHHICAFAPEHIHMYMRSGHLYRDVCCSMRWSAWCTASPLTGTRCGVVKRFYGDRKQIPHQTTSVRRPCGRRWRSYKMSFEYRICAAWCVAYKKTHPSRWAAKPSHFGCCAVNRERSFIEFIKTRFKCRRAITILAAWTRLTISAHSVYFMAMGKHLLCIFSSNIKCLLPPVPDKWYTAVSWKFENS